jgi:hypothetical protein
VFGSFTYYLPELCPTRLRGTGPGFTSNTAASSPPWGRFWSARSRHAASTLDTAMHLLFFVGFVPLAGLLVIPFMIETRDRA